MVKVERDAEECGQLVGQLSLMHLRALDQHKIESRFHHIHAWSYLNESSHQKHSNGKITFFHSVSMHF